MSSKEFRCLSEHLKTANLAGVRLESELCGLMKSKENKHHNHTVSTFKGIKAVTSFIPVFELFVKSFNNVIGNVIFKAGDTPKMDLVGTL